MDDEYSISERGKKGKRSTIAVIVTGQIYERCLYMIVPDEKVGYASVRLRQLFIYSEKQKTNVIFR